MEVESEGTEVFFFLSLSQLLRAIVREDHIHYSSAAIRIVVHQRVDFLRHDHHRSSCMSAVIKKMIAPKSLGNDKPINWLYTHDIRVFS